MDFLTLAKERYSVRSYKADQVPAEIVEKILEAGRLAPTACNNQPQRIIAVQSEAGLEKFRKCTHCHFSAPLAFIVCVDKNECWTREFDGKKSADVDGAIVTTHMMLEAAELGIGTCWVMYFIPEAVVTEFELPENLEPVAVLTAGYPSEDAKPAPRHEQRKPLSETIRYE